MSFQHAESATVTTHAWNSDAVSPRWHVPIYHYQAQMFTYKLEKKLNPFYTITLMYIGTAKERCEIKHRLLVFANRHMPVIVCVQKYYVKVKYCWESIGSH